MKKKHILLDSKEFHNYCWLFDGKKATLYVDGKPFKKKMPMTMEFWFKAPKNREEGLEALDELRIRIGVRQKIQRKP